MAYFICSARFFLVLLLLSAIPIAYIIHYETSERAVNAYEYHSSGWLRECTKWDDLNRRFLVSFFEGGFGVIPLEEDHASGGFLAEVPVVTNVGLGKNSTLGFVIDRPRNRALVVIADVMGAKYSALAAYDLTTWGLVFLTQLSGAEDGAFADDVAVDPEGRAYITDTKRNKIWKVGANGEFVGTITSPLFAPKEWYKNIVGLNGIVYHPNGYLLVVHTFTGKLFKVDIGKGDEVKLVNISGSSLRFGDGMELMSSTKLVVAGNPSRLVESSDDWETASVVGKLFSGATHRLVTSATVKDGKVYLNHMLGFGYPKRKHLLAEAVFYK